jgi:2-dehydropantoate 2-reductase
MRFLIIGAGAIGGYVGGSLAAAGHAVTFLARPAVAAVLQSRGLRLTLAATGQTEFLPTVDTATSLREALSGQPYDCCVLAIKAYDTDTVATDLKAVTASPPALFCLQNGVDGEADLARIFGAQSVVAGSVSTPVSKRADGDLVIEKVRGMGVALGHPISKGLADALTGAHIRTRLYPAAGPMKWSKLLTNLAGNATCAILDLPVTELFGDPRLYHVEVQTLLECLAVMRALGHPVVDLPGLPARALAWAVRWLPAAVARPLLRRFIGAGRGGKMPSLNMDLHSGRPRTEVYWLNGAVARHGALLGVPTPVNQALTETLEGLSSGRLDLAEFRHRPEELLRLLSMSEV